MSVRTGTYVQQGNVKIEFVSSGNSNISDLEKLIIIDGIAETYGEYEVKLKYLLEKIVKSCMYIRFDSHTIANKIESVLIEEDLLPERLNGEENPVYVDLGHDCSQHVVVRIIK
jgi:hypothetical protein